jgi:hypothetical protein
LLSYILKFDQKIFPLGSPFLTSIRSKITFSVS